MSEIQTVSKPGCCVQQYEPIWIPDTYCTLKLAGLPELKKKAEYPRLKELLDYSVEVSHIKCLDLGREPNWELWLPRPGM